MHSPAISLKLKRFRHRFGIGAPRVVVRRHTPWQWVVAAAVLASCLLGVLIWMFATGALGGGQLAELRAQIRHQHEELIALRSTVGTEQNAVSIERAAQQQLLARIQGLERENASLKEEVLIFERLVPSAGQVVGIRVENFRLLAEEGRYRFRLLFAFQPSARGEVFRGRYQIVVPYRQEGVERQLSIPLAADEGVIEVRHFLRREGAFEVPAGAKLGPVEVRVLQGGTLKTRRTARL